MARLNIIFFNGCLIVVWVIKYLFTFSLGVLMDFSILFNNMPVFVSQGWHNTLPWTGCLKAPSVFSLTVPEAGRLNEGLSRATLSLSLKAPVDIPSCLSQLLLVTSISGVRWLVDPSPHTCFRLHAAFSCVSLCKSSCLLRRHQSY